MALMGHMMSMPLLISTIIEHAARNYGSTEVVSRRVEGDGGDLHRTTYAAVRDRAKQLANVLAALGVQPGERIGTLAWNGYRHLEIYYGVSGSGAVCHTINPRLFADQIAYIVSHADDQYVFFDLTFVPLVEGIAPHCPNVKGWVAMTDRAHMPASSVPMLCYEDLLAAQSAEYTWPQFDENTASSLCYTSGTTGNPKGALYSHRSTVLHSYGSALPDALGCSAQDVILPVVPMFHVNAWGLPYSVPLVGAKLVFPGPKLDGASLYELFEQERVSFSAGVPTVWLGLLQHVQANRLTFSTFRRTVIGGSACPPAMIRTLNALGVEVIHAWGMTEMSPLGTTCKLMSKHDGLPDEAKQHVLERQGRAIYGVEMKIVDGNGHELPWDGKAFGDLHVRGPWTMASYYRSDPSPLVDGWFPTGDVANIDPDGYMQITDRSKDVIKSGGEWISSIDVENVAAAHPAVHMAACIACRHPKWDERPLLVVMRKPGAELTRDEMLRFFEGKVAKWWIPDDVVFVTEIPLTATGKMQKLKLREQFRDYQLPLAQA
ncbi:MULTISPECIES: 3-(methylthio)propionyl-CoA ligase [Ralstonia solanacearum species complex]|uniref:3-(methylthio)propionyl-CoA ligase n=1 Tax=Ralstonia solanacearum species complex TaxID=3116862 RepID=UPI000E5933BE|nr:3-(methylthio)propionyl-CoA ligase [Ralstonia solanacearum]BEU72049.1 3-(methylthio)propionyl-CoA ligase [Ralstonia pseudosolanacearum]AXV76954.1 long-chain fatty acid--CoA ligase [Ralstonia solanacearum]AXV90968.1 long-chain fatty acid--CoA ligase [Ralstonia solanacearum]AXW19120.1 long-chain fatty acid--CoA ligase [Ralstonia solanacearum]AXW62032.1 long-chain fatty acid--CoA ligase [Ralstonia solanacearum]